MLDETDEIQSMLSEGASADDPDSYREANDDEIIGSAPASEDEAEAESIEQASESDDEMEADKFGAFTEDIAQCYEMVTAACEKKMTRALRDKTA
jgi:hypothetical protein